MLKMNYIQLSGCTTCVQFNKASCDQLSRSLCSCTLDSGVCYNQENCVVQHKYRLSGDLLVSRKWRFNRAVTEFTYKINLSICNRQMFFVWFHFQVHFFTVQILHSASFRFVFIFSFSVYCIPFFSELYYEFRLWFGCHSEGFWPFHLLCNHIMNLCQQRTTSALHTNEVIHENLLIFFFCLTDFVIANKFIA